MATSLTEAMPVGPPLEANTLRLRQSARSSASVKLFRPLQSDTSTKDTTSNASRIRADQQRGLQPARKKLTTLEAQRVMAVLSTTIRRVELASILPHLVVERRPDFDVGFGAELSRQLEEHGVLVGSLDELKEAQTKQERRASTASSAKSAKSAVSAKSTQRSDSAQSRRSSSRNDAATPTGDEPNEDDPLPSLISTSKEALSRNVALVEQRMAGSARDVLRAFAVNPAAGDSVLNDSLLVQRRSESANEITRQLKCLRDFLMSRLLTTPVENVEWSRHLREVTAKEKYNSTVIATLTSELNAAEQHKDTEVTKQNDKIRQLQADIHHVERSADDAVRRTRTDAEKQEAAECKNSEGKLAKLQQDLAQVRAQYANVLARHRDGEQTLRKRKFQVETEVENWIQKFDADMGERQDEYEEIDAVYTEEKRQLNELEERFRALETEYNRIMDERRRAREAREAAERHLQALVRAALTIQAFWRSFKVRKAIKAKKRRGAAQKKGK